MPNLSNMPIGKEFVRAWPTATEEVLYGASVWPMQCFRLPTDALQQVTNEAVAKANQAYVGKEDEHYVLQLLNYHLNEGLAQLEASNKLIAMADTYRYSPEDWVIAYGPNYMVHTDDGWTILNPNMSAPILTNVRQ